MTNTKQLVNQSATQRYVQQRYWGWQFGKLTESTRLLAAGPGKVKDRVWLAFHHFGQVDPSAALPECRDDIEWVRQMVVRYPAELRDKCDMDATYRRTQARTAVKIAERMFSVYVAYQSRRHDPSEPLAD